MYDKPAATMFRFRFLPQILACSCIEGEIKKHCMLAAVPYTTNEARPLMLFEALRPRKKKEGGKIGDRLEPVVLSPRQKKKKRKAREKVRSGSLTFILVC